MEIIGSVAFAISGAVVGKRLKMDLFGVTVLGC
ncbi:MAG: TRIC cation channel family protein, partial [Oscillospiraceae bacterium]|nr:TRIC cation channel family protein [Oscillospiraceae bacterium]